MVNFLRLDKHTRRLTKLNIQKRIKNKIKIKILNTQLIK
jgi:hypothetical protein